MTLHLLHRHAPGWVGRPHGLASALLQALRDLAPGGGYRPERHYMRGGRTPGARSLARA